jgi:hypothetical protein
LAGAFFAVDGAFFLDVAGAALAAGFLVAGMFPLARRCSAGAGLFVTGPARDRHRCG